MSENLLGNARLVIPSRGRADRQLTLAYIPPEWRDYTVMLVHASEEEEYRAAMASEGVRVAALEYGNLDQKRQAISDMAAARVGNECIMVFDDDLKFGTRTDDDKFVPTSSAELGAALDWMWKRLLAGVSWVGLSNRFMAHTRKLVYNIGAPSMAWGFNAGLVQKLGIRFDDFVTCGEWHVCLSLLEHGLISEYTTAVVVAGSAPNKHGGCKAYRTDDTVRNDYLKFERAHPVAVKLKPTDRVQQGVVPGVGGPVRWKRAYDVAPHLQRYVDLMEREEAGDDMEAQDHG